MDLIESYREELKLVRKPWSKFWVAFVLVFLILVPWFAEDHVIYILTLIFIYSIGVQGQNLLIGYTGQISFGQAGFLAIGAFTFGHLSRLGLPWPVGLVSAGLTAGLFGLTRGHPFAATQGPVSGDSYDGLWHCSVSDPCQLRASFRRSDGPRRSQAFHSGRIANESLLLLISILRTGFGDNDPLL